MMTRLLKEFCKEHKDKMVRLRLNFEDDRHHMKDGWFCGKLIDFDEAHLKISPTTDSTYTILITLEAILIYDVYVR